MQKFWKFIRDWGHFGFLGFGTLYLILGDYSMACTMYVLFLIDEAANQLSEKMKDDGKN